MTSFPVLKESFRVARLEPPAGQVRMVLDTDTFNEIDDQFAVTHALLSPERLTVEALYAAPFHNELSTGPADGMQKSYDEILRLLQRLGKPSDGFVFKGSTAWMAGPDSPVESPAARDLVSKAMAIGQEPLYVVAIGAPTNIASAMLIEPRIIEKIVVVWLGGHAHAAPHFWDEFNFSQDIHATRIVFDSGVPLVQIPCAPVTTHLTTTLAEIERFVKGTGPIGDYLHGIFAAAVGKHPASSRVIWDISTIAWLVNPSWLPSLLVPSPLITDTKAYTIDARRHLIRCVYFADRDAILRDLFTKLAHAVFP